MMKEYHIPTRIRNTPGYLNDYVCTNIGYLCTLSNCVIPNTYEEAVTCLESMKWKQAMENEIEAFIDNHTFTKVSKSENMNTVGGRWLYTIKDGPNNEEIFKAHYVAKGYSQIYGKDYHETFAPTAKMTSLRILMQISAHKNLHIHQMDVKTAYLNAPVYCDIYLEPPEGHRDDNNIWKLNKSLYGLKQTCRNWNIMIHNFFIRHDFIRSDVDPCGYFKRNSDNCNIVLIWVGDIILASSSKKEMDRIKNLLKQQFKMKGVVNNFFWYTYRPEGR